MPLLLHEVKSLNFKFHRSKMACELKSKFRPPHCNKASSVRPNTSRVHPERNACLLRMWKLLTTYLVSQLYRPVCDRHTVATGTVTMVPRGLQTVTVTGSPSVTDTWQIVFFGLWKFLLPSQRNKEKPCITCSRCNLKIKLPSENTSQKP